MRRAPSSTAWEIGVLLATPPSISMRSPQGTGARTPGDRAAREDRVENRPVREPQLFAGDHVHRDDVQRDRQVVELVDLHVLGDQPPKSGRRYEMVAGSEEPE